MDEKMDIVVAFDLDDTLYAEYDYQTSGIRAVGKAIKELYGRDITEKILCWRNKGERDLWGKVCQELLIPSSVKDSLLWIYRLHEPQIVLDETISDVLVQIRSMVKQVVILTDGRSVSQRQKLKVLGLGDLRAFISEEYKSEKPDQKRFTTIMSEFPVSMYLYVGDNLNKDFIAPNSLGWKTVGLRGGIKNIHVQNSNEVTPIFIPERWINSIIEIVDILQSM